MPELDAQKIPQLQYRTVDASLRLYLFGGLSIEYAARSARLRTRKAELLLAYLALYPGVHFREQIAALFWGESPDAEARRSLRVALAHLRKTFGAELISANDETIGLNPRYAIWVDALAFELAIKGDSPTPLTQTASDSSLPPALAEKQHALGLYRGELLAGFYEDWILPLRERLRELYLAALLDLAHYFRAHGDYAYAMTCARRVLETDHANETAHRHLMFCAFQLGDRETALHQYTECVRALHDELGIEPAPETIALYERIQTTSTRAPTWIAPNTNLPARVKSFIGRTNEIAEIRTLLRGDAARGIEPTRLVTLTGAGGCGKTRLALETARTMTDAYPDGIWWIEFAALNQAALVAETIARVLGIHTAEAQSPTVQLVELLQPRWALLVLDNCEHVLSTCAPLVEAILQECPRIQFLATSRETLNIEGEVNWIVPSLSVPRRDATPAFASLMQHESIRLFVERARAARQDFALTPENAAAVVQICQRLDGIPLALELAAVRTKLLSPAQIAERLDDAFNLLTQGSRTVLPRQQTLRALIDWSYGLLDASERILFQRLALFIGGWTLESAVEVCASEPLAQDSVLDLLARLHSKSLIIRLNDSNQAPRYLMLDTIRQYAQEKLNASGEAEPARRRFFTYWLEQAKRAEPELTGAQQVDWLDSLETEHNNFRAALDWSLRHDTAASLQLAVSLSRFWFARSYFSEARSWLERALAATADDQVAPELRADALRVLGRFARFQGDHLRASESLHQSLGLYQTLHNKGGIARSLNDLGLATLDQGNYAEAKKYFQDSLTLQREVNDTWGIANVLNNLGLVAMQQKQYAEAEALFQASLELHRAAGRQWFVGASHYNLSLVALYLEEYDRAELVCRESLRLRRELGDKDGVGESLKTLGEIAYRQARYVEAKTLCGEALRLLLEVGVLDSIVETVERLAAIHVATQDAKVAVEWLGATDARRAAIGIPLRPSENALIEQALDSAREQLGGEPFDAAWGRGRTQEWDRILSAVLAS